MKDIFLLIVQDQFAAGQFDKIWDSVRFRSRFGPGSKKWIFWEIYFKDQNSDTQIF